MHAHKLQSTRNELFYSFLFCYSWSLTDFSRYCIVQCIFFFILHAAAAAVVHFLSNFRVYFFLFCARLFLFLCTFWKFCPGYEPQRNISINEIVSMFTLQLVGRIYFFDMWLFGQLATAWHVSEFFLWFRKRSIKLWRNYELNIIYKHHRS